MTTPSRPPSKTGARPYVVFGPDEYARPRAARYWSSHFDSLAKAAADMNARLVEIATPSLAEIVAKVAPVCWYGRGSGSLPYVTGETYAALAAAAVIQVPTDQPAATAAALPPSWHDVAPGHLVLARETRECGWWEAVVVEHHGDRLKLRYRDYPGGPDFVRHRSAVALISAPAPAL